MNQLVLFDIDGTLIRHVGNGIANWVRRFRMAAKEVYGVDPGDFPIAPFHGKVDRQIAWMLLGPLGVTRKIFLKKFQAFTDVLFGQLLADPTDQALYQQIPEAKRLVDRLGGVSSLRLGVLTGNMERVGRWKLAHAGYEGWFMFGVWGDEADDRFHLAKTVYEKANVFFHESFGPDNTVIIGDTAHDIACARHIGARVIAVTTGGHAKEELVAAKPDLLVDSLADPGVLAFFQLKNR